MRSFAMMELTTCAFILTLVSLVTATPHGYGSYGVKGGAVASAQSSAVAGAHGSRGGFSGSFSTSSSSSSSSSSASSSSSSSAFSYSGSGAGIPTSPGSNGNTGCSYGICQNSGTNEIPGHQGSIGASSDIQGYNAANSVSVVVYGASPGAACQGSHCNDNSDKCSSGQCQPKLPTETSPTGHDSTEKCISGKCGSASPYDDSDDIHFVAHSSKSLDSKDHSFNDKTKGYTAGSNCRNGNCDPSAVNAQPSTPSPTNSYFNTNPSKNPQPHPANPNSGLTPGYNVPATHLETPHLNSNCNSWNCKIDHSKPSHESLPTSYNVPSHDTYDSNEQNPSCVNGKCDNHQKGSYPSTTSSPLSTNYLSPHSTKGPSYANPSSSCSGSNCYPHFASSAPTGSPAQPGHHSYSEPNDKAEPSSDKLPIYTGGFGGPPGLLKPNEYDIPNTGPNYSAQPSTTSNNQPTSASTPAGCNTPSCSSPVSSSGVNPQSHYGSHKPSTSGEKQPTYTGGFGGPGGILKPNEFNMPTSTTAKPAYFTSPTYNTASTAVIGCNTPNCFGSPATVGTISTTAQSGSYGTHKESVSLNVPNNNSPTYTGGFGGPPGMLKPNEFDIQVPNHSSDEFDIQVQNHSSDEFDIKVPVHSSNPSYNSHPPTLSFTGCKTPNCNGYPVTGSNAPSGSYGASSEFPPYTGGLGGPPGIMKPNEYNIPHTAPNGYKPAYSGSSPNLTPTSNNMAGCKTPNCGPASVGDTTPQSSYGIPKPIALPHPISTSLPGYTSNYRPVGVSNPTAPAVAPISPSYANTHPLHPHGIYFDKCKTGNCGAHPTSGVDSSTPSGSHDNSAGCKTGNCAGYSPSGPIISELPAAHDVKNQNPSGKPASPQYTGGYGNPFDAAAPSGYNLNVPSSGSGSLLITGVNTQSGSHTESKHELPAYTGGFGGPPGLLKPNDNSKPDDTSMPNKPLTGTSTPATCSSGKCNPNESSPSLTGYNIGLSGAHATASSSASADAVVYTGGFGGPPGLLTPYDSGKVDLTKIIGEQNQGLHYGGANTPSTSVTGPTGTPSNIGSLVGSVAGATAISASANSDSYGFNTQGIHEAGNGVKGGSPCVGGCGSRYQDGLQGSGSSAAAGAKSLSGTGAFGFGGSYASSSASAHSSAGAYTKGGYGKR